MALPSPPIAYYPLGTSAWNGNYLAENNAIGDYVFDFDNENISSNNFIDINSLNSNILNSSFSIGIWIKKEVKPSFTDNDRIIDLTVDANTSLQIICDNASQKFGINFILSGVSKINQQAFNSFTASANVWNQIVLTWDGSSYVYYFNGQPVTSTGTVIIGVGGTGFFLGKRADAVNTTFFNGEMSNVQIFNSALSSTEVETLYNYGSPIKTLANIPQSSNLKAWYKLDASEVYNSTTTEWSIDNNQNPSAYSSSLDFDAASSDYIDCGDITDLDGSAALTLSAWVKPTASGTSSADGIIAKDGATRGFYLATFTGNKFRFLISTNGSTNDSFNSNLAYTTNEWYHLAATWDGSNLKLYINGSLDTTQAVSNATGTFSNNSNTLRIGNNGGSGYFNGSISNASIWNTALTSTQVTELYNNGTPSNLSNHSGTSNLVSWWKLNNTTTGIEDSKGSNNGTNNGATEYPGFVNVLAGDSSGMSQANLVQSDLQTVAPYSKYAMNFDGTDYINCGNDSSLNMADNGTDSFTFSFWIKRGSTNNEIIISKQVNGGSYNGFETSLISNKIRVFLGSFQSPTAYLQVISTNTITGSDWKNVVITYDGSQNVNGFNIYINKVPETLSALKTDIPSGVLNSANFQISGRSGLTLYDGSISNLSYWNTALTSAQVTEIYNQGLPSNLNSHSAYSNLVSWWQLGENSSFDGNDWIVADEKGSNNGTSTGMPVGALTNGVGTTANGVSSGMSEGNLVGDAPYSTANALSTNMVVTSRVTGSGNTP